jgi:hypothetical protein
MNRLCKRKSHANPPASPEWLAMAGVGRKAAKMFKKFFKKMIRVNSGLKTLDHAQQHGAITKYLEKKWILKLQIISEGKA